MFQTIFEKQDILPTPSSQTTTTWPLRQQEGAIEIISLQVGHDVGSPIIQAATDESWAEVMQQVLNQYQDAWERLAAL